MYSASSYRLSVTESLNPAIECIVYFLRNWNTHAVVVITLDGAQICIYFVEISDLYLEIFAWNCGIVGIY